ncbi:MAG: HEAT repeat domain-containing protein, partial [Phycisphaerae bacterium]|nr:HEAT repeat domain-containing protein [Phycisphaerae bacterium]
WIGYYGKERAEEALLAAWRSPDVWVRVKALWMLAHFEEKDVEKRVMMAMRSREAPERRAASAMCSSYAYPNCFQKLVAMSKDSDMIVRRNVAGALGSYDDKKAVPVLKMLLYDKSRDMILQVQSARSLAKHGKSDGVSIVIDMLKEKIDWRMRNRVAGALTEITGEEFGGNHEKWSQWWEKNKNNPRALQKDEEE